MLAVHIQLFAFPSLARWNPTAYGDLTGLNFAVWLVTAVLADGKFIAIFAMLLGVTIVMQTGRDGTPPWSIHLRRMAALLVLGVIHAYGVWYGDMLVPLALCGTAVFVARRLSPPWLLSLGLLAFASGSALYFWLVWSTAKSDPVTLQLWREQWTPGPWTIGFEVLVYRGGWSEQLAHRVPTAWNTETWDFVTRLFWQMTGLMLIGMGLFKLGVLSAVRSRRVYAAMAVGGFGGGTLLTTLALWRSTRTGWDLVDFALVSQPLHYWANLLGALAWVAVVMLLCQHGRLPRLIAAVGQTALSNYLLQSLVCTTIFYGHGLGLFGRVDRAGQFVIVLAIWTLELVASAMWLRYFAVGPVEWVTRWFIFRRRLKLRRLSASVA
jgi:uncharacterized protein